jgi:putative membrane protein
MQHPISSAAFPKPDYMHWTGIALVFIACGVASINPLEFASYILHQVGTLIGLIALLVFTFKGWVSRSGFNLSILFILLHIVGAHYLYSFVPYNDWLISLFGFDLNQYFGWSRNMYDRLVHFAYGLLLFKITADVFSVSYPGNKKWKIALLAIQFIMASSMVYELIEWAIAVGMSPEEAENYNGQQGDIWDAQKDMALATLGALIAWLGQIFYTTIQPKSK